MKNWAYYIILIWYLWMSFAQFELFGYQTIRWSMTIFLFIISLYSLKKWKLENPSILIILLLCYSLLSCIWANDKLYAILRYIAFMQMMVWCIFAVPTMIKNRILSIEHICKMGFILSVIGTILIIFYGSNPIPYIFSAERYSCKRLRIVSTGIAAVAMYSFPFLCYYINEVKSKGEKICIILLILINFVLLIASKGRAAIITTIIFIPLLFYLFGLRKRKLYVSIILIIIILSSFSVYTWSRTLRLDVKDITSNRLLMAQLLWHDCNSRTPLIGCGNAMDRKFLEAYIINGTDEEIYTNPHNQFISVFYNWGWIGVVLFYGFIITVFIKYIQIFKYNDNIPEKKYLLTIGCYFFMQVIKCNNSGGLDSAGSIHSYMYWMYGGILLVMTSSFIKNNNNNNIINTNI